MTPSGAASFSGSIRHPCVTNAVGETRNCLVAAKREVRLHRIPERPAALALRKFDERTRLRTVDSCAEHDRFAAIRRLRISKPEQPVLGRSPRAAGARRAILRLRTRGPPRRQPQPVNFADDGVSADPDLGSDRAAGQSGDDAVAELLDALRGPGSNTHDQAPFFVRPVLGRQQGEGRARSFFEPTSHEAPFRRMTADKRHHSPSRIRP